MKRVRSPSPGSHGSEAGGSAPRMRRKLAVARTRSASPAQPAAESCSPCCDVPSCHAATLVCCTDEDCLVQPDQGRDGHEIGALDTGKKRKVLGISSVLSASNLSRLASPTLSSASLSSCCSFKGKSKQPDCDECAAAQGEVAECQECASTSPAALVTQLGEQGEVCDVPGCAQQEGLLEWDEKAVDELLQCCCSSLDHHRSYSFPNAYPATADMAPTGVNATREHVHHSHAATTSAPSFSFAVPHTHSQAQPHLPPLNVSQRTATASTTAGSGTASFSASSFSFPMQTSPALSSLSATPSHTYSHATASTSESSIHAPGGALNYLPNKLRAQSGQDELAFRCQWRDCSITFDTKEALIGHVNASHLLAAEATLPSAVAPAPDVQRPETHAHSLEGCSLLANYSSGVAMSADFSLDQSLKCLWNSCSASLPASGSGALADHSADAIDALPYAGSFPPQQPTAGQRNQPFLAHPDTGVLADQPTATLVRHLLQDHLHVPSDIMSLLTPSLAGSANAHPPDNKAAAPRFTLGGSSKTGSISGDSHVLDLASYGATPHGSAQATPQPLHRHGYTHIGFDSCPSQPQGPVAHVWQEGSGTLPDSTDVASTVSPFQQLSHRTGHHHWDAPHLPRLQYPQDSLTEANDHVYSQVRQGITLPQEQKATSFDQAPLPIAHSRTSSLGSATYLINGNTAGAVTDAATRKEARASPASFTNGASDGASGVHVCGWEDCSEVFSNTSELMDHISSLHIGSGKSVYVCGWAGCTRNTSGKGFNQRQKIVRHIRAHVGDKPYNCQYCSKTFSELTTLNQHIRTHTNEKPFLCSLCGKSFAIQSALTIHLRTHSGEKPFMCPVEGCGMRFAESSNLSKHVKTHKEGCVAAKKGRDRRTSQRRVILSGGEDSDDESEEIHEAEDIVIPPAMV